MRNDSTTRCRDLKSDNVLVSTSLRAKITDFGTIRQTLQINQQASTSLAEAAQRTDVDLSMTMTAAVGTPLYMAPELLKGSHSTSRYSSKADVFSFGVLMWEVFTQRMPDLLHELQVAPSGPLLAALFSMLSIGKRLQFDANNGMCPGLQQSK